MHSNTKKSGIMEINGKISPEEIGKEINDFFLDIGPGLAKATIAGKCLDDWTKPWND